jgi:hypothetical protein
VVSFIPQSLQSQGKSCPVPTGQEIGWAPEPVWIQWQREKLPAPAEKLIFIIAAYPQMFDKGKILNYYISKSK